MKLRLLSRVMGLFRGSESYSEYGLDGQYKAIRSYVKKHGFKVLWGKIDQAYFRAERVNPSKYYNNTVHDWVDTCRTEVIQDLGNNQWEYYSLRESGRKDRIILPMGYDVFFETLKGLL